jgi:hypothetical protein
MSSAYANYMIKTRYLETIQVMSNAFREFFDIYHVAVEVPVARVSQSMRLIYIGNFDTREYY